MTLAKYKREIQLLMFVLTMMENWENNGTKAIGLVTPTPGVEATSITFVCFNFREKYRHGPVITFIPGRDFQGTIPFSTNKIL